VSHFSKGRNQIKEESIVDPEAVLAVLSSLLSDLKAPE